MKAKGVQIFALIAAVMLLLTGCAPREFCVKVGELPEGVWAVTLVRIDPSEEDYAENDLNLCLRREEGEEELFSLKGTQIDLYDEGGWRCYELHADHSTPSYLLPSDIYLVNFTEDTGFNKLSQRFGAIRIAAIDREGNILKITAQAPLQSPETFSVASGGTYDYAANTLELDYDTQRIFWGGMTLWELSDLCMVFSIFSGIMLFIMSLTRSFNFRSGRWARVVFAISSLPSLAAAVTVAMNALPYFDPTGVQAGYLPQRLLAAEFFWILAALRFFQRKPQEKNHTDERT